MTDDQTLAPEAGAEVAQTEVEQTEAPEAVESTQGQVDETPPAEAKQDGSSEGETDSDAEEKSKSAARRERRKAAEAELRQKADAAEAAAREANERLEAMQKQAQALKKPTQADYPDFDEYQAALSAYHSVTALDRREAERAEAEARQRFEEAEAIKLQQKQAALDNWQAQSAEAMQKDPDFQQVATNPNLPITQDMAEMMFTSDQAADLAYHLGKNPDLCAQIAAQDPVSMARSIGRLEAQLSAPKPKTATSAPDPIKPVRGKAPGVKPIEEMTMAEYKAARAAGKI